MNDSLLIDNHYFPCASLVRMSFSYSYIKIEACESYQKNSFRNRCIIAGSNGLMNLSVPLEKGRDQKAAYRDIRIAYQDNWQVQHWRSIVSCYRRAPYFEYYAEPVEAILQKRFDFLFDLNMEVMEWLQQALKIPAAISLTDTYLADYAGTGTTDFRNHWTPGNYRQEADSLPRYFQLFEDRIGFQPNLSILDVLFCTGPKAFFP